MILGLCGCTSAFKREYISVSEYTEEDSLEFLGDAIEISSYDGLKRAINSMVTNHTAEERFLFSNEYDGSIRSDLDHACWEVRDGTALGSYSVDYMSHDLTRILTYYKATVYINYKRTAADMASIVDVYGDSTLIETLDEALTNTKPSVVVRLNNRDLTEDYISSALDRAFGSNPMSCLEEPEAEITIHPNSGMNRIVEISLSYPLPVSERSETRTRLSNSIFNIVSRLSSDSEDRASFELYNLLASECRYDPYGELRAEDQELDSSKNDTLYAALVDGIADSHGIALAFSALCREIGIECLVVSGTQEQENHWWNIIKLDGQYYHVDVSADSTLGITAAFLRSDADMRTRCWWNIEDYPECPESVDVNERFVSAV